MTDNDRNTRTLIVSFVIALMVMIPLRFVEVGQNQVLMGSDVQVLGEEVVAVEAPVLEEPYNQMEMEGCWTREAIDGQINEMTEGLDVSQMTREELDELGAEIAKIESRICD